jgi:hypothetical protein
MARSSSTAWIRSSGSARANWMRMRFEV